MITDDATQGFSIKRIAPDQKKEERDAAWATKIWAMPWSEWVKVTNGDREGLDLNEFGQEPRLIRPYRRSR